MSCHETHIPNKVLSLNQRPHVTHIIHIADIHVRLGDKIVSRKDEYKHVFDSFVSEISSLECVVNNTCIVMIAGDIFHAKCKFETEGAIVLFEFINNLLALCPVIVCLGNHDMRQEDPLFTDNIQVMVKPYEGQKTKFPIHYLKDTGTYRWENLMIGIVSVKDTLRPMNTSGIVDDLPQFPQVNGGDDDISCKIAMFHGTISAHSIVSNGKAAMFGYPLDWISGYDIVVLGDNHVQQVHTTSTTTYGYSGSLIQQDFGESLFGHGYILWDVQSKRGTCHHIHNKFGAVTIVKNANNDIVCKLAMGDDGIPLDTIQAIKGFPEFPKVRLIDCDEDLVIPKLAAMGIYPSSVKKSKIQCVACPGHTMLQSAMRNATRSDQQILSTDVWLTYMRTHMGDDFQDEWITSPHSLLLHQHDLLPSDVLIKVKARNKKITDKLDIFERDKVLEHSAPSPITFKSMRWSYLMAYGKNNHVDFSSFEGGIALLNGKNATGKSSFLDVICIAIYGTPTSSRDDIGDGVKIVHDDKPTQENANVILDFEWRGDTYQICRVFGTKKKTCVVTKVDGVTKVNDVTKVNGVTTTTIAEGQTCVSNWCTSVFGKKENLLMSSMMCQHDTCTFFHCSPVEQKAILDKALNMSAIASYQCALDEARKAHDSVCNELASYVQGRAAAMVVPDTTSTLEELVASRELCMEEINTLTTKLMIVGKFITGVGEAVHDVDNSEYDEDGEYKLLMEASPHNLATLLRQEKLLAEEIAKSKVDVLSQPPQPLFQPTTRPFMTKDTINAKLAEYALWMEEHKDLDVTDQRDLYEQLEAKVRATSFVRPRAGLDTWTKKYNEWDTSPFPSQTAEVLEQRIAQLERAIRIDDELATIEGVAFNKECWACCKNHGNLDAKIAKLKQERKDCHARKNAKEQLHEVRDKLKKRIVYESQLDFMRSENKAWKEAQKQFVSYDNDVAKLQLLSVSKTYHDALEKWETELQVIAEQQLLHSQWDEWCIYENCLRRQQAQRDIDNVRATLAEARRQHAIASRMKVSVERQLNDCKVVLLRVVKLIDRMEQYEKTVKEVEALDVILKSMQQRAAEVTKLYDVFLGNKKSEMGFKAGVYVDYVLPALEKAMNDFIYELEDSLQVNVRLISDKISICVNDRGNVIPLGNVSGYQRCVLSMAIRVAFTRLASIGTLRHMFLDEAFVAFDKTNASKLSDTIHHLMQYGGFESVVLMSHQNSVRDVANVVLDIQRTGRFSILR